MDDLFGEARDDGKGAKAKPPALADLTPEQSAWCEAAIRAMRLGQRAARGFVKRFRHTVVVRDRALAESDERHAKAEEKRRRKEYAQWMGQKMRGLIEDEKAFEYEGTVFDGY